MPQIINMTFSCVFAVMLQIWCRSVVISLITIYSTFYHLYFMHLFSMATCHFRHKEMISIILKSYTFFYTRHMVRKNTEKFTIFIKVSKTSEFIQYFLIANFIMNKISIFTHKSATTKKKERISLIAMENSFASASNKMI